ncbi:hypothetical protein IKQ74_03080 [Candidatus Saccharibacteria bacterium]|nr:hypothetical protein [Candidatus Saccharibacteria bacterium]
MNLLATSIPTGSRKSENDVFAAAATSFAAFETVSALLRISIAIPSEKNLAYFIISRDGE